MKSKFLFPVMLIAGLMLVSFTVFQVNGQTAQNKPVKEQVIKYTCTVHPEIVKDSPGNCPKCGMKLVEKQEMQKGDTQEKKDSACMKKDHEKMMQDSTKMKKCDMKKDSTSKEQD